MLVGAVGCSAEIEGPQEADDGEIELRSLDVSVKNEVCPKTRFVARLKDGAPGCPPLLNTGWTKRTLFAEGTPYLSTLTSPFPANKALSRYCTYERTTSPTPTQLSAVTGNVAFDEVAPDCAAMLPTGTLADAVTPALRDLIRNRLGYVTDTDLDLTSSESGRAPVRVEVVDTIPTMIPPAPNDEHGLAVADLARDIACPGSSTTCSVVVENVLGLPLVKDAMGVRREFEDGGYYGTQSFYAAAIFEAMKRWENSGVAAKLVLNLSVGWPPEWFGGGETEASPGVDAVETALRYARCRGALIIVAAGNDTKDCQSGPTAPALWETRPSPTANECLTEF
ncbi:MAG: S8/S53 family peptidase, partial [Myxococcales bacterium]|nr:S8/S53 family peptidase [Myxococcales bacterium]